MSTRTFKRGDTVFNLHGQEGRYIAAFETGHIVEPAYDSSEADEHYYDQDPQTWREVFKQPPTARLHAEVAEVGKTLEGVLSRLEKARAELRDAETETAAARRRIAARPDLRDLDLWLQGKVTHIVSLEYHTIRIGTVEETLRKQDRDKELRLLSLLVDPKANRFWTGYAAYSDGSSNQTRCLLATSLEHARERAAEHIRKEVAAKPRDSHGSLAASAIKYGVEISDELRKQASELEVNAAEYSLKNAREQLARAQESFADAEARAKAVGAAT